MLQSSFTLMMQAVDSSEISANIYQTTQCYLPEDTILILVAKSGTVLKAG
jgi:hypothetical protein